MKNRHYNPAQEGIDAVREESNRSKISKMTDYNLTLLKRYLETLQTEVDHFDREDSSEVSASIKQLVDKCVKLANE